MVFELSAAQIEEALAEAGLEVEALEDVDVSAAPAVCAAHAVRAVP